MIYRFIDIETYCELDIRKVGRMKYIGHPSFEIIIVGWVDVDENDLINPSLRMESLNFKQFTYMDFNSEVKNFLIQGFNDPNILMVAHNAPFEIGAFRKVLHVNINLDRVVDTMVMAYQSGLPASLDKLSKVLDLKNAKLAGTALINYFSKPCKATKTNKGRIRNLANDNPGKWEEYCTYNKYDVFATVEAYNILKYFQQPLIEHELWKLDRKINEKGLKIDVMLLTRFIKYVNNQYAKDYKNLKKLTKLDNPNSNTQFKDWLDISMGEHTHTVRKEALEMILERTNNPIVKNAILIKQRMNKTSLKKIYTLDEILYNGRLYDFLQFSGTGTGRWAGRGFQIHNLPKNKLGNEYDIYRRSYRKEERPMVKTLNFEISQLLRSLIIPDDGKKLMIVDYSAIEARVAAWFAGEHYLIEAFYNHRDIYIETAARMFDKPYDAITKEERQDGKVAVLACGYGGGANALASFAPDWPEEKRQLIVDFYRQSNSHIVDTWRIIEKSVKYTYKNRVTTKVNNIHFSMKRGCLIITLPSGRTLNYVRFRIGQASSNYNYTYDLLQFEGIDNVKKQWCVLNTYGGKLFENIVQAIARDLLAHALLTLDSHGYDILFHVHDEIICQANNPTTTELNMMNKLMCQLPKWAKGLPIRAEGFISDYYMKEE